MTYKIRYTQFEPDYGAWCPTSTPLEQYMEADKRMGDYGKGKHQFIPKDYC